MQTHGNDSSREIAPGLCAKDLVPDRALTARDEDAFNHEAIAERVADLITVGEDPLNVALFGPWGSGKSSVYELLRRALLRRKRHKVGLVRYDAWKYGGKDLQRNFISHAARELGIPENRGTRPFYRGLYEKRRTAHLDFQEFDKSSVFGTLVLFGAVFLGFVLVFGLLTGALSIATDEDFLGQIATTLPEFLASAAVAAVIVGAAKLILDGTRVDVEQAEPSAAEEFTRTFKQLIRKIRTERGLWRLVFFVDELDRCSAEDVIGTLTAIKTFLDENGCVFVVAADREVLERALRELPQETPINEEAPYYSSASAFLDKVFQHQIALPPLRGSKLTGYARELVVNRGGLWAELRNADDERLLDRVIYVLIPSHVRSPRRVKVLLNNFATNARIAQSRDVEWPARAREIANLTVLQTEFPLLAADLHQEPRLPTLLLNPPTDPSERTKRLLTRHGGTWRESRDVEAGEQEGDVVA